MGTFRYFALAYIALCYAVLSNAVDQSNFRKCAQTGFCNRLRVPLQNSMTQKSEHYARQGWLVVPESASVDTNEAKFIAHLANPHYPEQKHLQLSASLLKNGMARVRVMENKEIIAQFGERWETNQEVLVADSPSLLPESNVKVSHTSVSARICSTSYSDEVGGNICLEIEYNPFMISLIRMGPRDSETKIMTLNDAGLFHFEQRRTKGYVNPKEYPKDIDGMWGERFRSFEDSKPNGPMAISLDVSFPGATHLYGLPEHASSFSLNSTRGGEGAFKDPLRLYNLDVFEYDLNVPMALYGSVPFVYAHAASSEQPTTSGFFFMNSAEMFVDISRDESMRTHFMVESGILDVFLFSGPTPRLVNAQYMSITGLPILPPRFSIGYHQCRWNYKSQSDVMSVDRQFDAHDIPYDTLWLDIEHTDGKKYFTWDKVNFPDPTVMQLSLAKKGRHMVTIIDPHIKRDDSYTVHKTALEKDLYVKNKDNGVFEGWCWPGASSYIDFLLNRAKDYWRSMFGFNNYPNSTPFLHTWNDMNEPSVFNGPEVSMPKDCLHVEGKVEHRDVHNAVGLLYHESSARGLQDRQKTVTAGITEVEWHKQVSEEQLSKGAIVERLVREAERKGKSFGLEQEPGSARVSHRPFVLSRAFFSGTQRTGAVWTGDNRADWSHLEIATPMLLSLGMTGIQFSGADVGGFFGNPGPELMERWFQAAAFTPFFRAHAHIDAKRREPYLFGEPYTSRIRSAIRQRYVNYPYIYTQFALANVTGAPPLRPIFFEFPEDQDAASDESSFMLGDSLLIHPITSEGQISAKVRLPGTKQNQVWYDLRSGVSYRLKTDNPVTTMAAPREHTPVLVRGGRGLLQQQRARRSLSSMTQDPYTVLLALSTNSISQAKKGQTLARTTFYHDDGVTNNFQRGHYLFREFKAELTEDNTISISSASANLPTIDHELSKAFGYNGEEVRIAASVSAEGSFDIDGGDQGPVRKIATIGSPLKTTKEEFSNLIERIIIYGLDKKVKSVSLSSRNNEKPIVLSFSQTGSTHKVLTIRMVGTGSYVAEDFLISVEL